MALQVSGFRDPVSERRCSSHRVLPFLLHTEDASGNERCFDALIVNAMFAAVLTTKLYEKKEEEEEDVGRCCFAILQVQATCK